MQVTIFALIQESKVIYSKLFQSMKSWDFNLISSKLKHTKSHGDQRGQSYASVDIDVNRPVTYYALPFRPQSK